MAIGSIINLGGGGGSLGGKGMIIVDTNTMTVGDKVRVRSVYDVSVTEDKTVVTVGTPLYFQVEPYDYYKICMVQTISDVEVEIGGEYTTIDVGQTVLATALNLNTLAGHQGLLNAHQHTNKLAIGDEVPITVGGSDWIMQVADFNHFSSNDIVYVSKYLYAMGKFYSGGGEAYYTDGDLRPIAQSFYNNIADKDKQFIKQLTKHQRKTSGTTQEWGEFTDYVWIPNIYEINGTDSQYAGLSQFPIFSTQANRVKSYNSSATDWWSCDGNTYNSSPRRAFAITNTGATHNTKPETDTCGVLPCFILTADS